MKSLRRTAGLTTAASLSLAAAFLMTGCAVNPVDAIVKQTVDNAVEDTMGIEVVEEGSTIPADFPLAGQIVDGAVDQAGALTMDGLKTWSVTLNVADPAAAFAIGKEKLLAAGYEETFAMDDADGGVSSWNGSEYTVIFNVTKTDGKTQADYVVSENE